VIGGPNAQPFYMLLVLDCLLVNKAHRWCGEWLHFAGCPWDQKGAVSRLELRLWCDSWKVPTGCVHSHLVYTKPYLLET